MVIWRCSNERSAAQENKSHDAAPYYSEQTEAVDGHFPWIGKSSGPRLNMKTVFPRYGIPMLKIIIMVRRHLYIMVRHLYIMVRHLIIVVRRHLYIETAPRGRGIGRVTYLDIYIYIMIYIYNDIYIEYASNNVTDGVKLCGLYNVHHVWWFAKFKAN